MTVLGWLHEGEHAENFSYALVECTACKGSHLIEKATGMSLAEKATAKKKGSTPEP